MTTNTERLEAPAQMHQYRYLSKPKPFSTTCWPGFGDFVVLSIDPVATVAHLDKVARRAARKLPAQKFLALIMTGYGLPLESKPFTSMSIALVRQGLPTTHNPPFDTPDMCYPIFPNTYHPNGRETIRPLHPLPFDACYFETTSPFLVQLRCRISTTPRDYRPVLPVPVSQLSRLNRLMSNEASYRSQLRNRLKKGELGVVAAIPLPPSPLFACDVPLPVSQPISPVVQEVDDPDRDSDHDSAHECSQTKSFLPRSFSQDEVSVIGSDDDLSTDGGRESGNDNNDGSDSQLDLLLHFEDFIKDTGNLHDPVVDVWYDLDMVEEVTDPIHYIETCNKLKKIIEDAEIRLGIKVDPAVSQHHPPSEPPASIYEKSERAASVADGSSSSPAPPVLEQEPRISRLGQLLGKIRGISSRTWHRVRRSAMSPRPPREA